MSQEIINTGAYPNDGEGDPLRVAFTKINNNFFELYSESSAEGPNGAIQYSLITTGSGASGYSQITNGVVTNIIIQNSGSGYKSTNPPIVVFTNAAGDTTGSGAEGLAELTNGEVTAVTIINGGTNYTLAPTIEFLPTTDAELQGSANLVFNTSTNTVDVGANIIPTINNTFSLGNNNLKFKKLSLGQDGLNLGNVNITETGNVLTFSVSIDTLASVQLNNITSNVITANSINAGGNSTSSSLSISTLDDEANQIILELPAAQFRTGLFKIESRVNNNSIQVQSITIEGTKLDNFSIKHTAYGTVFGSGVIVDNYDLDISGGNIRLKVSPSINILMTHKIQYTVNS